MTVYTYHTDGAAFFRRPATTMTAREFPGKKSPYSRPAERPVTFGEMLEALGRSRALIDSLDNVVERRPRRLQERP